MVAHQVRALPHNRPTVPAGPTHLVTSAKLLDTVYWVISIRCRATNVRGTSTGKANDRRFALFGCTPLALSGTRRLLWSPTSLPAAMLLPLSGAGRCHVTRQRCSVAPAPKLSGTIRPFQSSDVDEIFLISSYYYYLPGENSRWLKIIQIVLKCTILWPPVVVNKTCSIVQKNRVSSPNVRVRWQNRVSLLRAKLTKLLVIHLVAFECPAT